jgi:hypothetical protein
VNDDHATGDIDGFDVSRGRKTPRSASFVKFGQPPLAHELRREARVHAVEPEDDDALRLRVLERVAHPEPAPDERDRPEKNRADRQPDGREHREQGAGEREAGAGADVRVRGRGPAGGDEAEDEQDARARAPYLPVPVGPRHGAVRRGPC